MSEAMLQDACDSKQAPRRIRQVDYRPPVFLVRRLDLEIELDIPVTRIAARLEFERCGAGYEPWRLDGVGLTLRKIELDGVPLGAGEYCVDRTGLTVSNPPPRGVLLTVVEIEIAESATEGLFLLDEAMVSNCEPEGFRRITFFPDRPDVLARMTCMLIADARRYPTLLSNGNLRGTGALPGGRHYARWEDPFPKASYLFALAAGRFERLEDTFVTASGRTVQLVVHARPQELAYCKYGLGMLAKAMRWDEQEYGLEYDLDALNLVVMRSYPGGAMECKGLNLYASEFFLAAPQISTDEELLRVASVIGHEYFHNWTGNRVGCRNWFELSLKEGFTVFRQQQFLAALTGEAGARVDDVTRLREQQYPEDDGGMAHAVRPASYVAVSNFYTRTVYEKGAELIRMMRVIVGEQAFREAARRFLADRDGSAAAIDELIDAIERVSGTDLQQFRRWYDTVGRPRLQLQQLYDAAARCYTLTVTQHPPVRGESVGPLHVPVCVGLLDERGEPLPFTIAGRTEPAATACLLQLSAEREIFVFQEVASRPVLSFLRGFSAPVDVHHELEDEALALLTMCDTDGFSRCDAARQLAIRTLHSCVHAGPAGQSWADAWFRVVESALERWESDPAIAARSLRMPSLQELMHEQAQFDLDLLQAARTALRTQTARRFHDQLCRVRTSSAAAACVEDAFDLRRLRNRCLWYLVRDEDADGIAQCREQFRSANRMEDEYAALQLLVDVGGPVREDALSEFYRRWQDVPAALDHWFRVQAASEAPDCARRVEALSRHSDMSLSNATRLKAVFDTFTANLAAFHDRSGVGYDVVCRIVLALSRSNPRLAARFLKRFDGWHRFDSQRQAHLQRALQRVLDSPGLADELHEVATQSLRIVAGASVQVTRRIGA